MTQISHEFKCPHHGLFSCSVPFGEPPPPKALCPIPILDAKKGRTYEYICEQLSPWVPPTVGVIWGKGFART